MGTYQHQDWNQVVFKKPKVELHDKALKTPETVSKTSSKPAWKIEKQVDSEEGKPITYVTKLDADLIIKGRIEAKLTQKQLAQRLNMQEKDIKDIETCKAVENKAILSKIKRMLNIKYDGK